MTSPLFNSVDHDQVDPGPNSWLLCNNQERKQNHFKGTPNTHKCPKYSTLIDKVTQSGHREMRNHGVKSRPKVLIISKTNIECTLHSTFVVE